MPLMVPPEIGNSPAAMLAPLPNNWRNCIPIIGPCGRPPDKIRQQLQVLRDTGLLLHVERGCWRLP
jgi:hypothetical protein